MKIELAKRDGFWSLIDPENVETVVVVMNENAPSIEINFDKLPEWAKKQVMSSEECGLIVIKDKPAKQQITEEEKKPKKKVAKE